MHRMLLLLIVCFIVFNQTAFAEMSDHDTIKELHKKSEPVLNKLKRNNNFKNSYNINAILSTSTIVTISDNGTISIPSALLGICETDDILAANLAIIIAIIENGDSDSNFKASIKKLGAGIATLPVTLFIYPNSLYTAVYGSWTKGKYYSADLVAVEYLINAGYNPVALEVANARISGDNIGSIKKSTANSTDRQKYIHKYIQMNYPQYLEDKQIEYYKELVYLPCLEKKNYCSTIEIPNRIKTKVEKQKIRQGL